MDYATPVPAHVLRPHHISLISVLVLAFSRGDTSSVSPKLMLHVMRVVSKEIAETQKPISHALLLMKLMEGGGGDTTEIAAFTNRVGGVVSLLNTTEELDDLFRDAYRLVLDRDEVSTAESPPLERRSFFGLFVRRCCLSYRKLSYLGTVKLHSDWRSWCGGDSDAGYDIKTNDLSGLLLFSGSADEQSWAQTDPFERYTSAMNNGDPQIGIDNLRRYFDQRFSTSGDSPYLQHALLQLALALYQQDEWTAAREALAEAIKTARERSDKDVLRACTSLMARMPNAPPNNKSRSYPIQPSTSPLDVLWDIRRIIEIGDPLLVAFKRIYQSMGCQDAGVAPIEVKHNWARHAMQAALWNLAGVSSLAKTHEGIVMSFAESGEDSRLNATCAHAHRVARNGKIDEALALLVDPDTWKNLTMIQFTEWAEQIWEVLAFAVHRKGQNLLYQSILQPKRPTSLVNRSVSRDHLSLSPGRSVVNSLGTVMAIKGHNRASVVSNHIMDALWSSEFRGFYGLYRTAVTILADVGLELGMAKKGRMMIEECLPQLLNGDDIEQRAYACMTLARCIIVEGQEENDISPSSTQRPALFASLPYLRAACEDYASLDMYECQQETLYLISVVYHNLGMYPDRDRAAEMHRKVDKKRRHAIEKGLDEFDVGREVLKLMNDVSRIVGTS